MSQKRAADLKPGDVIVYPDGSRLKVINVSQVVDVLVDVVTGAGISSIPPLDPDEMVEVKGS